MHPTVPQGLPFSADTHPQPHHPRREKGSDGGERSWLKKKKKLPQLLPLETPSSGQPLEEQLSFQLVLITLTSSRACRGGVPLCRSASACRRHPLPATCQAHRLSSSARLALGSPQLWPSSPALSEELPNTSKFTLGGRPPALVP